MPCKGIKRFPFSAYNRSLKTFYNKKQILFIFQIQAVIDAIIPVGLFFFMRHNNKHIASPYIVERVCLHPSIQSSTQHNRIPFRFSQSLGYNHGKNCHNSPNLEINQETDIWIFLVSQPDDEFFQNSSAQVVADMKSSRPMVVGYVQNCLFPLQTFRAEMICQMQTLLMAII